jgi:hypothetical protein
MKFITHVSSFHVEHMTVTAGAESVHLWLPDMLLHSIFRKVRWRVSGVIDWISLSMLFRKPCSVRRPFPYIWPLRMLHRKKSGGVKSCDRGGQNPLEMILSSKKDSISAMLSLDVWHFAPSLWIALKWHDTLTQSPIPTAAVTGATDTSATVSSSSGFVLTHACLHNPVSCSAWNYVRALLLSCCWRFWLENYTVIFGFQS